MGTALANQVSERADETQSRERRHKARQEFARGVSGRSLVELRLDVPRGGNEDAEQLFLAGLQRLETELGVSLAEMNEDAAGYYGFFITELPALLARRRASRIESHATWDRHLSIECYGVASGLGTTSQVPRETVGA